MLLDVKYVEDRAAPGTVVNQEVGAPPRSSNRSTVLLHVVASATVMVLYLDGDDEATANDLTAHLRRSTDPQYVIRSGRTRATAIQGEVRYNAPTFESLATALARTAGPWLGQEYGRRVGFRTTLDTRLRPRAVLLLMPGRVAPTRPPSAGWLGAFVRDATDAEGAARGALLGEIQPKGPASMAGLLPGDVVVQYAGQAVADAETLTRLAHSSSPGDRVRIRVRRENSVRTFELIIGDRALPVGPPPGGAPDVMGQPMARARDILVRAGFTVNVKYLDDRGTPGSVIGQFRLADPPGAPSRNGVLLHVIVSATVSIHYLSETDERAAMDLASHLRLKLGDPQFAVRAYRSSSRRIGKDGDVLYSQSTLSSLAETVASVAAAWLSRTYRRRVDVSPVVERRVSPHIIILAMPGSAGLP